MTKITRKQQEILLVNGKLISVEGGAVVNSYDLSDDEYLDTLKYIAKNKYHVSMEAIKMSEKLNKKK